VGCRGVEPKYMGIGPRPRLARRQKAGMKLEQLDLIK